MIHHYITGYEEDGKRWVESWIQIDVLWLCLCLSRRRIEVRGGPPEGPSCLPFLRCPPVAGLACGREPVTRRDGDLTGVA